ncbi:hypothetical protein RJ639_045106 [Escallonia herrerae]|uniref:1-acylglycerol-3-phosphate O-acyltransferase n=1 Tax=Escallonia herrerae TaxID=1293975 RepID=A0AA88W9I2_9ASTE|nr:hypothetical protein RJ639_045106 [Escallonia herrerae]
MDYLSIMKNVLLPKTNGFFACFEDLRGSLDAVYDLTIGYKFRCPSFLDNAFGVDPSEVHIHVSRIPLTDIPPSEDEVASWLMNAFSFKDQLLSEFYLKGHFPHEGTEGELSTDCEVICTFFFFSSAWFKVYVTLFCAYMGICYPFQYPTIAHYDFVKAASTTVLALRISRLHISACTPKSSTFFINTPSFFLISSMAIFTASSSRAKSTLCSSDSISISNRSISTRMLSKSLIAT